MLTVYPQGIDTSIYNKLSESARKEIQVAQATQNLTNQVKSYSAIAGYGKEIGIAVKEGLTAVKDVTIDLSKSEIGKTTIWLIVWKVAGKDMVRIIIGILLMAISIILVSRSYFRTFRRRVCIKDNGWFKGKEYQVVASGNFWNYPNSAAICHVLFLLVLINFIVLLVILL